jgi:hypothetical protein
MTPHQRLEEELRNALRRQDAPPNFAERVLARVEEQSARAGLWQRLVHVMQFPALRFATAAVLFMAILGGSMEYRHYRQEKRAGEAAKEQLMLALRITGTKLQYVQAKVNERGSQQFEAEHDRGEERQ